MLAELCVRVSFKVSEVRTSPTGENRYPSCFTMFRIDTCQNDEHNYGRLFYAQRKEVAKKEEIRNENALPVGKGLDNYYIVWRVQHGKL